MTEILIIYYRKSFVDSIVKPNFDDAEIIESYMFKYYITGQQVQIERRNIQKYIVKQTLFSLIN